MVLNNDGTARFAHHTVQQFLIRLPPGGSTPGLHFRPQKADIGAREICITYLLFSDFKTQITIPGPKIPQQASQLPTPTGIIASVTSRLSV